MIILQKTQNENQNILLIRATIVSFLTQQVMPRFYLIFLVDSIFKNIYLHRNRIIAITVIVEIIYF